MKNEMKVGGCGLCRYRGVCFLEAWLEKIGIPAGIVGIACACGKVVVGVVGTVVKVKKVK